MFRKILAILCAAALAFSGALAEMPQPESVGTDMIMGESAERYGIDIVLYYSASDGASLTPVRRTILAAPGEDIARRLVEELLTPPSSADLLSVAPGDARILRVEACGSFATVNLALDASGIQEAEDIIRLTSAICSTLTASGEIEGVNVLFNSVQEDVLGLPLGVLREADASVTVNMARIEAESERMEAGADLLTRTAAVYFPSRNGLWMLPEMCEIGIRGDDYAEALLEALAGGPADVELYAAVNAAVTGDAPEAGEIYVTDAGLKVMDIMISGAYRDEIALQGIEEWQLAAAFTLTMCSFIPGLDGVRVVVDGEPVTRLNVKGVEKQFGDGVMTRRDFDAHIGDVARLYFPTELGQLREVRRAMSGRRADSAYSLILQLISGPSALDVGVLPCMPEGVDADDVLGVAVREGTAIVNMSWDFYRLCQTLDAERESQLVYSMVNTLCELGGIEAVTILIEGERVETLANDIYLGTSLMPNPGIIAE